MTARAPIDKLPRGLGLRQRQLASGSWRVWWEPNAQERADGAEAVDLDAARPTWSIKRAKDLKAQARGDAPRPRPGTSFGRSVAALIDQYLRSSKFARLKPATQTGYRIALAEIEDHWGHRAVRTIDRPQVYAWYEDRQATAPTYAVQLVRTLSLLMTYAELVGWRDPNTNPCLRLGLPSAERRARFASWAEYDALIASARALGLPTMAAAIALAVFSAQRQKDILEATVGSFVTVTPPGWNFPVLVWNLVRSKRSNAGSVPLHDEAAALIHPLLVDRDAKALLLTDERTGAPLTRDLLTSRWEEIRARAASGPSIEDLHAHYRGDIAIPPAALRPVRSIDQDGLQFRDLRRTFGVWARQGGAERADVADVLGNSAGSDPTLAQIYMPAQLATAFRAVSAITRPEAEPKEATDRKKA